MLIYTSSSCRCGGWSVIIFIKGTLLYVFKCQFSLIKFNLKFLIKYVNSYYNVK